MKINNLAKLKLGVVFAFALGALMLNDFGRIEIKAASPLPENSDISLDTTIIDSSNTNTIDPMKLNLNLTPSSSDVISLGKLTTSVTTDNPSGYKLSLKADNNTLTDGSGHTIASVTGTITSPAKLTANTWGFAVPKAQGDSTSLQNTAFDASYSITESTSLASSSSKFASLPTSDYPIRNTTASTTTNSASATTDIFLAAAINNSQISGNYSANLTLMAVNNPLPAPTISSITPNSGPVSGNTTITISGTNFTANTQVYLDLDKDSTKDSGEECTISTISSDTSLTCNTPPSGSVVGAVNLTLTTAGGTATKTNGYTYTDPATDIWLKAADSNATAISSITGTSKDTYTVNLDANMIPVVNKRQSGAYPNNWCNYDTQQWCNAVTIKPDALAKYQSGANSAKGSVVAEEDILGYFTYIPRYAYEVQRYHAFNKVSGCGGIFSGAASSQQCQNIPTSGESFAIHFEKPTDSKKIPASPSSSLGSNAACYIKPTSTTGWTAKDYRTECNISRAYGSTSDTTWATHPAFTLAGEELPGLWVAKYEVGQETYCNNASTITDRCGANLNLTSGVYIKPYHAAITYKYIGAQFSLGLNLSKNPKGITGGNTTVGQNSGRNLMNLSGSAQTMQMKNDQWGAIAYLSASTYGTGATKVYNNGYYNGTANENATNTTHTHTQTVYRHMTGCGPIADKSKGFGATCTAYNSTIGQQASTTGNVYGIYDMVGGTSERVMGNYNATKGSYMTTMPDANYVNIYQASAGFNISDTKESWMRSTSFGYHNFDYCTFTTCGGQALYETTSVQSVSHLIQAWGEGLSHFLSSGSSGDFWVLRGGNGTNNAFAGLWASDHSDGSPGINNISFVAFRVVLVFPGA